MPFVDRAPLGRADFFLAAKHKRSVEEAQGKMMVDAAKAAGMEFTIFLSVADVEAFEAEKRVHHIHGKGTIEKYLKASGLAHAILRPVAFFENFDDAANYNPLTKGSLKFLTMDPVYLVATYDLGVAAAAMLNDKPAWSGKTLSCSSWKGSLAEVAAALEAVSGDKTVGKLAMPLWARSCMLSDLNAMCLYFEGGYKDSTVSIEEFKKVVPNAMDPAAWFRYHGKYASAPLAAPLFPFNHLAACRQT